MAPPSSSNPPPFSAAQPPSPSFSTSPGSEPPPDPLSPSHSPCLKHKEHIITPLTTSPSVPNLSYCLPPQDKPPFTWQKSFSSFSSHFPSADSHNPPSSSSPHPSAYDSKDSFNVKRLWLHLSSATAWFDMAQAAHRNKQLLWASQAHVYEDEIANLCTEVTHLRARVTRGGNTGKGGAENWMVWNDFVNSCSEIVYFVLFLVFFSVFIDGKIL